MNRLINNFLPLSKRNRELFRGGNNQKGAGLIWVIIFSGAISIIIANLAILTYNESRFTANSDLSYKAYVAAQGGVDLALYNIRQQIQTNGIQNLADGQLTRPFWNNDPQTDTFDEQKTDINVSWTINRTNPTQPLISVDSLAIVTVGEKEARRKLHVEEKYTGNTQAETFEDGVLDLQNNVNTVNGIKDKLNAFIYIDVYKPVNPGLTDNGDNPKFDLRFTNKNGDAIMIKVGDEFADNGVKYPSMDFSKYRYRWRFNYIGGAGVQAVLERSDDFCSGPSCNSTDIVYERRWVCALDNFGNGSWKFIPDEITDYVSKDKIALDNISISTPLTITGNVNNRYALTSSGQIDNIVGFGK